MSTTSKVNLDIAVSVFKSVCQAERLNDRRTAELRTAIRQLSDSEFAEYVRQTTEVQKMYEH